MSPQNLSDASFLTHLIHCKENLPEPRTEDYSNNFDRLPLSMCEDHMRKLVREAVKADLIEWREDYDKYLSKINALNTLINHYKGDTHEETQ